MAVQQALSVGSGNSPPNNNAGTPSSSYAVAAPQFVGGDTNPNSGAIIPATQQQADVAPPPQPAQPTTQLGKIGPTPTQTLGTLAGTYAGGAIGGEIGAQLGGGADLSSAVASTTKNLGTTLQEPLSLSSSPALSTLSSATGAGVGAGLFTAATGAALGEQPKVYVPESIGAGAGTFIGSVLGGLVDLGPVGALIGGIAGTSQPAQTFISHAVAPVESFLTHLFSF